jgi:hypothetical protein
MHFAFTLFPALLLALLIVPSSSQAEKLFVNWEELEPIIKGRTVSLVLPDGRVPRGEVIEVRPDSLVLGVKTRDPLEIDRASVHVIMLGKRGVKWRIVTTILGAAAGFVSGMFVSEAAFDDRWSAEGSALSAGIAAAGAISGYYYGYSLDSRSTTYISVRH